MGDEWSVAPSLATTGGRAVTEQLENPSDPGLLEALLAQYDEQPERRPLVADAVQHQFGRRLAILVIDSCGFSRRVRRSGILHALAVMYRLERRVRPLVEAQGGRVLRREADNVFIILPEVRLALSCAQRILQEISAANELLPAPERVELSIGIGFGDVLLVSSGDVCGDEMNVACKLGEDLAKRNEILLSDAARQALDDSRWKFEETRFTISGLSLRAHRLLP
jgi:adenylate cyclase